MGLRGLRIWENGRMIDDDRISVVERWDGTQIITIHAEPIVAVGQTYSYTIASVPLPRPFSPSPLKRMRALPSFTPLRFAPEPKPRAPRQHVRPAFVRCYQRHRESKAVRTWL